ncbi:SRPBCC family protein [Pedobacter boryungensis]|uniref:SRPBCC family protein n=1 Tax=Pedobacter boryungensis TaxID=869962 RepID=A0ABX2DE55_9SPHI|nr:SRPBCC family protein [Pedobacter boryungensis]NQX32373.1 SRPBCC family protein [Pedobacter boryungensis]
MKVLKVLLGIIVALVIIFFVGGMFLPKTYSVSRTTTINAPDSVIYKNVADFNEFLKWNPWTKMEPTAKVTITGNPGQPGHLYEWVGDKVGTGQMKLTEAMANQSVVEEMKFIKPMESSSTVRFDIAKEGNGNKATWTISGESVGTMNKWMGLFMDKMMGKDFEDGLKSLKEKSEKGN